MTDYESMWRQTADECQQLREQVERLKGNRKENPTLRDQFAMAALTGLLAYGEKFDVSAYDDAYAFADSMMKAREK